MSGIRSYLTVGFPVEVVGGIPDVYSSYFICYMYIPVILFVQQEQFADEIDTHQPPHILK